MTETSGLVFLVRAVERKVVATTEGCYEDSKPINERNPYKILSIVPGSIQ